MFPGEITREVGILYWVILSLAICATILFVGLSIAQRNSNNMLPIVNFLVSIGIMMTFVSLIV